MELKYFRYQNDQFDFNGYKSVQTVTSLEEAFDKSIEAWTLRAEGKHVLNIIDSCGLCDLFLDKDPEKKCEGCPIYLETDKIYCEGNVHYKNYKENNAYKADKLDSLLNADSEANWLKDLKKRYVTGKISYKEHSAVNLDGLKNKIIDEFTKELSEGNLYRNSGDNFIEKVSEIFTKLKMETNGLV